MGQAVVCVVHVDRATSTTGASAVSATCLLQPTGTHSAIYTPGSVCIVRQHQTNCLRRQTKAAATRQRQRQRLHGTVTNKRRKQPPWWDWTRLDQTRLDHTNRRQAPEVHRHKLQKPKRYHSRAAVHAPSTSMIRSPCSTPAFFPAADLSKPTTTTPPPHSG